MNEYHDRMRRARRRELLRILEQSGGYTSNSEMLAAALNDDGTTSTRAQVVTELSWLAEQGLIDIVERNDFVVATATLRGCEIAQGLATHPEIERAPPRNRFS